MAQKLNWGLLSTARINHSLIQPLTTSPRTHLLAVASRNQSSADKSMLQILSNRVVDFFIIDDKVALKIL